MEAREILHADMNSYYASVEMMQNPWLKGKAVAVCGSTEDRHGIVLAKSELAKKAGVKTGMVNWEARQRCPGLIVVPPHYDEYIKYSKLFHEICYRHTDLVEPFGMDEVWMDVTNSLYPYTSPLEVAEVIRRATREELGLTVSMGDSLYQKTFRETTVPFKAHKNRGEADMYYAAHTHAPLIDEETFKKAQELLNKRKEQFLRTETQTIYPLTSRIRCAECGSTFRRKVREENIKWVCSRHEREANACRSFYYSEDRIYDGIIRILNKLRFDEDILGQVSAKLDCAVERYKRNNLSAREKSQSIAELNGRILMLDQLRAKGYLASDVYHSQVRELQNQLKKLKEERKSDMETRLLGMQDEVRKLQMILQGIEKPLERFDETLFREIVQDIEIDKTDRMTVTVLGGLKFSEII